MRVQRRLLMARFTIAEGRDAEKSEQHEERDGHTEGDGNITVDGSHCPSSLGR